ncbi:hypothetical protein PHISP_07336 [Aspergillus sp. HF37]|nr:hypothetical protein PHISP_07336 [Aspergillus sp. HF37]
MKFFVAIAALLAGATARITERGDGHKCCFTLTSNGGVTDTAGQLDDGQVRVGGEYPPSHFCIDDDGCITDGTGSGCILTSATTQFQCNLGDDHTCGFEVNSKGLLTYKGDSHFVACKATPDEYNIYYDPDEDKVSSCVDITLTANGCNGCGPKPTETVTVTKTVEECPPTKTHTQPTHTKPTETKPTHTKPTHTKPTHTKPTDTQPTSSTCPTNLSGDYEFPHLIVPIDSEHPDAAKGTSFFGTISDTVSTIFNFDIPWSDAGRTCSLIFLFPEQEDLQTSSFTFSGDGKIEVEKLEAPATGQTTFNNAPDTAKEYGVTTIAPGNSYMIATFDCPAGERIAFEVSSAGTTEFHYFQDYNPAP